MLYKQYKYKFYLNLNHSVEVSGKRGEIHSHTWEIAMGIAVVTEKQVIFSDIEKKVNSLLDKYQDKYLNSIAPFNDMDPTLENVCDYLYGVIAGELQKKGWMLLSMEMSETPTRIYHVSELGSH